MKQLAQDPCRWSILEMRQELQAKHISAAELLEAHLQRIARLDPQINAYIRVNAEAARRRGALLSLEQPAPLLAGIPYAVKDLFFTSDLPTTMGSSIYADYQPGYDAAAVERLEAQGAVLLGKLNTHQFAFGSTGDRSYYGPVHNPHDLSRITGGSSSGSAAAVAAYLTPLALGTDTGGSIRMPASHCGVVGMKPSFGQVSKYGVFELAYHMDHVGPMTRTVADNALALGILAGWDSRDPCSLEAAAEDFGRCLEQGLQGLTIGVPQEEFYRECDTEIAACFEQTVALCATLGARIKRLTLPLCDELRWAFSLRMPAEAYAGHRQRLLDHEQGWDAEIRARILSGAQVAAHDYIEALKIRQQGLAAFAAIFHEVDAVLTPTVPILPTLIDQRQVHFRGQETHVFQVYNRFTGMFSLLGLPALSLPVGKSAGGLPIGLQIVGADRQEALLYRCARALEREGIYEGWQ